MKANASTRRRLVLAAASALVARGLPAQAQSRTPHRVAFLAGGSQADVGYFFDSFRAAMRELGYREGENLLLDERYGNYSAERVKKLAEEVAALKPAVIVANGGGIVPACRLTPPLPVVFLQSGDPVDAGVADSYPRPGRNATGVTLLALELIPKRLEILRQIHPKLRRVAFLASPEHAGQKLELAASRDAAAKFHVAVTYHEARTGAELEKILPAVAAERPDGALLFSDALMIGQRKMLAEFFLKHRIASGASWSAFPESGHLMSYGPERHAAWKRLAYFVDRIVKGARPADLPIELPSTMELVVNRRTAAAMGLVLPNEVLLRSDRVVG